MNQHSIQVKIGSSSSGKPVSFSKKYYQRKHNGNTFLELTKMFLIPLMNKLRKIIKVTIVLMKQIGVNKIDISLYQTRKF